MPDLSLPHAIALAAEIHEKQLDKSGEPYILHPLRVMEDAMRVEDGSHEVGVLAVLHDVLEDNDKYERDFLWGRIEESFGCAELVEALSRKGGEDYLDDYIGRIANSPQVIGNNWLITVKLADLRDNLNIRRQPTLRDKDLMRIQKYHHAYKILREALND